MNPKWSKNAIALTGSLGSGKSTVLEHLRQLGAFTVSADELAREVTAPGSAGLKKIAERFGRQLLLPDGSLDRDGLAALVFADEGARKDLEAITHPAIRARAEELFQAAMLRGYPLYVYEVPLLFEAGLDKHGFRAIVVVVAPDDTAVQRVTRARNIKAEDARRRLAAQLPAADKVRQADYVIDNSGSLAELKSQVADLFRELTAAG